MIDSAEQTILPLLTQYQYAVVGTRVSDNVGYFTTLRPCYFAAGQTVIVTDTGSLDGEYTISAHSVRPFEFSVTVENADQPQYAIIPSGAATLDGASAAELYANVAAVHNAILVVSVEIFQSITSPGNQVMSDTFVPTPFVLGRSLQSRVIGLLSPFIDVETMAQ
jgi:hypothetical protein